ncbi:MAG: SLBB domain-containing protein [Verrucomicrobia bacterium]|nr:SLBB domain-containing protein [Verrucomicrobiota bacterium]
MAESFSLSPGERAGVRGKRALVVLLVTLLILLGCVSGRAAEKITTGNVPALAQTNAAKLSSPANKAAQTNQIKATDTNLWFYVAGQVRVPNRYPWKDKMTVSNAVAMAGGPAPFAPLSRGELMRTNGQTIFFNLKKIHKGETNDLPVYPGDKISFRLVY